MNTYIERAAVKDEILSWAVCINHPELLSKEDTMYCIDNIPAADVVEVRHGHWIDLNAENSTGPLFKCSECSHLHNPNRNDLDLERVELNPLYCDACGTRMDKEDEHEAD